MSKRIVMSVGGLFLVVMAIWVAFTVAMRTKFLPVQDVIRRMNRAVVNPRAMEKAGQPGAYASVIRHLGRTTGTRYETPVQALVTDDGFVIPLPYGPRADWLQNVLAEGSAVIVHDGNTLRVGHPELVPSAVANPYVPRKDRRTNRLYGVDQFLQFRRIETSEDRAQTTDHA
jgi:deazaflavin-dependent oxidoreductase (nitroreductase family)